MVPTADRQKATVLVRIGFEKLDPRILPDMGVKVTFLATADEAAGAAGAGRPSLVPKAAIRTDNGTDRTCSSCAGRRRRAARRASTGGTDGDRVEVVAGLTAGERVVVSPPPALATGTQGRDHEGGASTHER